MQVLQGGAGETLNFYRHLEIRGHFLNGLGFDPVSAHSGLSKVLVLVGVSSLQHYLKVTWTGNPPRFKAATFNFTATSSFGKKNLNNTC